MTTADRWNSYVDDATILFNLWEDLTDPESIVHTPGDYAGHLYGIVGRMIRDVEDELYRGHVCPTCVSRWVPTGHSDESRVIRHKDDCRLTRLKDRYLLREERGDVTGWDLTLNIGEEDERDDG